jgi:hypothetical protein
VLDHRASRAPGGRSRYRRTSELALHGMTTFEPARDLAKQFQELAADARQLRDKITFLWENILRGSNIELATADHVANDASHQPHEIEAGGPLNFQFLVQPPLRLATTPEALFAAAENIIAGAGAISISLRWLKGGHAM